jgi:hypothetical protein
MWPERCAHGRAFVCRSHETYVVLLDEVLKGQVHLAVLLCDRDDDSQVRPDELGPRCLVAFLCSPAAAIDLFLVRKGSLQSICSKYLARGLGSFSRLSFVSPIVLSRILLAVFSVFVGLCDAQGYLLLQSLYKAPFWPSPIRPLKGPISYPLVPLRFLVTSDLT